MLRIMLVFMLACVIAATLHAASPTASQVETVVEAECWLGVPGEASTRGRFVLTSRPSEDGDAYSLRLTEPIDAVLWQSLDGSKRPFGVRCERIAGLGSSIVINGEHGAGSTLLVVIALSADGAGRVVFERASKFGFQMLDLDADGVIEICAIGGTIDRWKTVEVFRLRDGRFALAEQYEFDGWPVFALAPGARLR